MGLATLAAALNEEAQTLEDIYEPFLIQRGLLERTPRGRRATPGAFAYLGCPLPEDFGPKQLSLELGKMDGDKTE